MLGVIADEKIKHPCSWVLPALLGNQGRQAAQANIKNFILTEVPFVL
jgi:hypothetical protein